MTRYTYNATKHRITRGTGARRDWRVTSEAASPAGASALRAAFCAARGSLFSPSLSSVVSRLVSRLSSRLLAAAAAKLLLLLLLLLLLRMPLLAAAAIAICEHARAHGTNEKAPTQSGEHSSGRRGHAGAKGGRARSMRRTRPWRRRRAWPRREDRQRSSVDTMVVARAELWEEVAAKQAPARAESRAQSEESAANKHGAWQRGAGGGFKSMLPSVSRIIRQAQRPRVDGEPEDLDAGGAASVTSADAQGY